MYYTECDSAPKQHKDKKPLSSRGCYMSNINKHFGARFTRSLVSIRCRQSNNDHFEYSCGGGLISMIEIIAAPICAHKISTLGYGNCKVQVGEGLEYMRVLRSETIENVRFDTNFQDPSANQVALIIVSNLTWNSKC